MDFTLCSKLVELSTKDLKYASNILMKFITDENPHRVVVNEQILMKYNEIALAKNGQIINSWIQLMDHMKYWKKIEFTTRGNNYIEVCKKTTDKKLIVDEKEDYEEENCDELTLLNKLEAVDELKIKNISIIQTGPNSQASTGDNSPNIKK